MAGKTEREAADNFLSFLQETVSCVSGQSLSAYQQSKKLYKVWFDPPVQVPTRSGGRLVLSVTQVFGCGPDPRQSGQFKASTREYSYRLEIGDRELLAYHWHPNDSDLHSPHLHVRVVPRVHFPTSRVCLEDFVWLAIKYYGARPRLKHSEWTAILEKNKKAFDKMATWKIYRV